MGEASHRKLTTGEHPDVGTDLAGRQTGVGGWRGGDRHFGKRGRVDHLDRYPRHGVVVAPDCSERKGLLDVFQHGQQFTARGLHRTAFVAATVGGFKTVFDLRVGGWRAVVVDERRFKGLPACDAGGRFDEMEVIVARPLDTQPWRRQPGGAGRHRRGFQQGEQRQPCRQPTESHRGATQRPSVDRFAEVDPFDIGRCLRDHRSSQFNRTGGSIVFRLAEKFERAG